MSCSLSEETCFLRRILHAYNDIKQWRALWKFPSWHGFYGAYWKRHWGGITLWKIVEFNKQSKQKKQVPNVKLSVNQHILTCTSCFERHIWCLFFGQGIVSLRIVYLTAQRVGRMSDGWTTPWLIRVSHILASLTLYAPSYRLDPESWLLEVHVQRDGLGTGASRNHNYIAKNPIMYSFNLPSTMTSSVWILMPIRNYMWPSKDAA